MKSKELRIGGEEECSGSFVVEVRDNRMTNRLDWFQAWLWRGRALRGRAQRNSEPRPGVTEAKTQKELCQVQKARGISAEVGGTDAATYTKARAVTTKVNQQRQQVYV